MNPNCWNLPRLLPPALGVFISRDVSWITSEWMGKPVHRVQKRFFFLTHCSCSWERNTFSRQGLKKPGVVGVSLLQLSISSPPKFVKLNDFPGDILVFIVLGEHAGKLCLTNSSDSPWSQAASHGWILGMGWGNSPSRPGNTCHSGLVSSPPHRCHFLLTVMVLTYKKMGWDQSPPEKKATESRNIPVRDNP